MQCPKCLNRYYGTEACPICRVPLVPDDDEKTIKKRLKKTKKTVIIKPLLWLIRAAVELTIFYWALYFAFFYLCQFLGFLGENMEYDINVDIRSAGIMWLRYAVFSVATLVYCLKRKRL